MPDHTCLHLSFILPYRHVYSYDTSYYHEIPGASLPSSRAEERIQRGFAPIPSNAFCELLVVLFKRQQGFDRIAQEVLDNLFPTVKQFPDSLGRAVANMQVDELRRISSQECAMHEIRVLGDDREAVLGCKRPDRVVAFTSEREVPDVLRTGKR